jgi:AraC family transcriptional regulator
VAGFIEPASNAHHIVMTSVGFQFESRELGTGRWRRYDVGPGELCVVGAGAAPSELCWQSQGRARTLDVIDLYIDPAALRIEHAARSPLQLEPEWRVLRDPLLTQLLLEVAGALDEPQSAEDVFGDLATTLFALQLGRKHGVASPASALRRAGLSPFALRRVREHVASRLASAIRLEQLASLAGLSPFHFSRAFKASTGLSPHAYVLRCRIDEAKRLLAGSNLPVAEIARRTGFSGAGQLSTRFRACTGSTPTAFRRLAQP